MLHANKLCPAVGLISWSSQGNSKANRPRHKGNPCQTQSINPHTLLHRLTPTSTHARLYSIPLSPETSRDEIRIDHRSTAKVVRATRGWVQRDMGRGIKDDLRDLPTYPVGRVVIPSRPLPIGGSMPNIFLCLHVRLEVWQSFP